MPCRTCGIADLIYLQESITRDIIANAEIG